MFGPMHECAVALLQISETRDWARTDRVYRLCGADLQVMSKP